MCGEKKVMRGAKDKRMGSPPHVRGKAGRRTSCTGIQRITPACAGKSPLRLFDRLYCSGSPPHVRGKVFVCFLTTRSFGITPACAGKRGFVPNSYSSERDHPRMCGEKQTENIKNQCRLGSPPHVRGKANDRPGPRVAIRITPACAGKRTAGARFSISTRDHPRMCGEK